MKFIVIAVIVFCAAVSEAACPAGQSGSSVTACTGKPKWVSGGGGVVKDFDNEECTAQANSDNECVTFTDGHWMSGFSTGKNTCKVYHRKDCRGSFLNVNMDGRFKFYRAVLSFRCNCRVDPKTTTKQLPQTLPATEAPLPTTEALPPTTEALPPTTEALPPTTEALPPTTEGPLPTTPYEPEGPSEPSS